MAGSCPAPTSSRPGRPLAWPRPHFPPLSGENEGNPPFLRLGSGKRSVARTAESSSRVLCPGATTVRPTTPPRLPQLQGTAGRGHTAAPRPSSASQLHSWPAPSTSTRLSHLELVLVPLPAIPTAKGPISPPPSPQTSQTLPRRNSPLPSCSHHTLTAGTGCPLPELWPVYNSPASGPEGWSWAAWLSSATS